MTQTKEAWKVALDIEAKKTLQEKQLEIINHYGLEKQLDMLIEECSELIKSIMKYKRYKTAPIEFTEVMCEMADVENLIEQIKLKKGISDVINNAKEFKVDRELQRIEGDK